MRPASASTGTTSAIFLRVVPLLARVYPNGKADVNHFHAAGGMGFLIRELLGAGLLHADVRTVGGADLHAYTREPVLEDGRLGWREAPAESGDDTVLRPASNPFSADGGLRVLRGNLGRSVIKVSAVAPDRQVVEAPAMVFSTQQQVLEAFKAGRLSRDVVVVVREQGPRANGMPELHKLTPPLSVLQNAGAPRGAGHRWPHVGRIGHGAGRHPCHAREPLRRTTRRGFAMATSSAWMRAPARLRCCVPAAEFAARPPPRARPPPATGGSGRELFSTFPPRGHRCRNRRQDLQPMSKTDTLRDMLRRAPVIPVIVVHDLSPRRAAGRSAVRGRPHRARGDAAHAGGARRHQRHASCGSRGHGGRWHAHAPGAFPAGCTRQARSLVCRLVSRPPWPLRPQRADWPYLPGVMTPGELLHARELGFSLLKLFPAQQAGGVGMLKAMGLGVSRGRPSAPPAASVARTPANSWRCPTCCAWAVRGWRRRP